MAERHGAQDDVVWVVEVIGFARGCRFVTRPAPIVTDAVARALTTTHHRRYLATSGAFVPAWIECGARQSDVASFFHLLLFFCLLFFFREYTRVSANRVVEGHSDSRLLRCECAVC